MMFDILLFAADGSQIGRGTPAPAGDGAFCTLPVSRAHLAAAGARLTLRCTVPITGLQGYWHPGMSRPAAQIQWHIAFASAAQRNVPYLAFFGQDQTNRATLALTCVHEDVEITANVNQQAAVYEIAMTVAVRAETEPFAVLASDQPVPWTALTAPYRQVLGTAAPAFPPAAFLPVYCTWYAVHAALDMDYLETSATQAAALGFGTFIVDDGWCFDERKRVTPETLRNWYCHIGDWAVAERKLPGFKEHIARAQRRGLRYLLWIAPFFAGEESRAMHRLQEEHASLLTPPHEGQCVVDPRETAFLDRTQAALLACLEHLGLDGFKIDFLDAVPPSVTTPRSHETLAFIQRFTSAVRARRPEALIEFRQSYATPQMMPYATQFRAGDVPFDYLGNVHRVALIRLLMGDGVPIHADPVFFHPGESEVNVSRHMIAALAGVPMVSVDLAALTPLQTRIIQHWLGFYRDHLEIFSQGHWSIEYRFDHLEALTVTHRRERIGILLDGRAVEARLTGFDGEVHLLNLACEPFSAEGARACDVSGRPLASGIAPCGGRLCRPALNCKNGASHGA
jgi:alpha-galactosidase